MLSEKYLYFLALYYYNTTTKVVLKGNGGKKMTVVQISLTKEEEATIQAAISATNPGEVLSDFIKKSALNAAKLVVEQKQKKGGVKQ